MGGHDQRSDDLRVGSDAERRLRDAERSLADTPMQATDEAVIVTSADGTILRWSPGAGRLVT